MACRTGENIERMKTKVKTIDPGSLLTVVAARLLYGWTPEPG